MALVEQERRDVGADLAGLDALELGGGTSRSLALRAWSGVWPKVAGVGLGLLLWQLVVWSGWKPEYALPGPRTVLPELWREITDGSIVEAVGTTLGRAVRGYALALLIGTVIGALVARVRLLRVAFGSLITGLMTMPSIAWFPLAILLFKLSEGAILFVVVLGAAPAIANGLISGADQVPPVLVRAGRVLGAKGFSLYRHVVLPASLPGFVAGMKQGWAFAWRSLLAGELLVIIANKPSLGVALQVNRDLNDAEGLLGVMLVILLIGIVVDAVFFGGVENRIRRRRGLIDAAESP
jgi:NitT/TauT family transport system permease protein